MVEHLLKLGVVLAEYPSDIYALFHITKDLEHYKVVTYFYQWKCKENDIFQILLSFHNLISDICYL